MRTRTLLSAAALVGLVAAGCRSNETVSPPDLTTTSGLFARYVSMGNSITSGFQSAGINDSTQALAYPVLLAKAANAPFFYPKLNKPGCPAPFVNNVTQARVGGAAATACALRAPETTTSFPYLSNVAAPGFTAPNVVSPFIPTAGTAAVFAQFVLGGRSQVAAMMVAQPTFVSLWIGNNDVLGALLSSSNPGDTTLITPIAAFQSSYGAILDSITKVGAKAVLLEVVDPRVVPYATSGTVYWCLKTGVCPGVPNAGFPATFTVNNNCAPNAAIPGAKGDSVLVPWPVAIPRLSAAAAGASTTIDCSVTTDVVTPAEYKAIATATAAYNSYIVAQATQRNWAVWDPNPSLVAAKANPALVTTFPNLPSVATGGNVTFGSYFSLDGFHPSSVTHKAVADSLASVINRYYKTTIPLP